MNTPFFIRPATADDSIIIHRFMCELKETELDIDLFQKCFLENLVKEHYYHLVAEVDRKVAGFLSCYGQIVLHYCCMEYEIQELYVDAAYRSMQVGKQLLSALGTMIPGGSYLKVCSGVKRKDAHRFYEANGFELTGYRFVKTGG